MMHLRKFAGQVCTNGGLSENAWAATGIAGASKHPQTADRVKLIVALAVVAIASVAQAAERVFPVWMSGLRVGTEIVAAREGVAESFLRIEGKGPRVALHALVDARGTTLGQWGSTWPWIDGDGPLPASRLAVLARTGKATATCGRDALGTCHRIDGMVWGSCFVWLDRGSMRAAFVPNPIAPLVVASAADREDALRLAARHAVRALQERVDAAKVADAAVIAIRNATVIDGVADEPLRDAVIVIEGDRIRAVGRDVAIPREAHVIDAAGATVLPGLWDTHAHLKHATWGPAYLAVGVTSVRDVGMDDAYVAELRRAFNRRGSPGPSTRLAAFIDAAADRPHTAVQANTPAEARALVERFQRRGYEQIKIWENVRPEIVRELVREAHRRGMTVTGHVPAHMSIREAIEAGFDQINHSGDFLDQDPQALARLLRERNVVIEPTLVVGEFHLRNRGLPLSTLEPDLHRVAPDMQRANEGLHPAQGDRAAGDATFRRLLGVVRTLHDAGVPLLAGSDQGVPGYSLLREIELMTEAGLSNLDAIRTATVVPARVFGDADGGTIAPGRRADLVLVDGNPLDDIRALRRTRLVIRGGIAYDPARLRSAAEHR